jgi:DNA-directed RNA polymerase specialized sigma24 family protein
VEHWEIFEKALYKLPLESRRVIELCKFSDYSMKEVSTSLGLPVGTPKVRLHRGKQALIVRIKRETRVPRKTGIGNGSLQLRQPKESLYAA